MSDDSTIVITDIKAALNSSDLQASNKPAALLVVGGELNGTLYDLRDVENTLGRNADNTIPLELQGISRYHFKVSFNDSSQAFVEDMGSKNGTFLNNNKLDAKSPLSKGDIIKIGAVALKFIPAGDPERNAYDQLSLEANTDKHTGCYNKTFFNNSLDQEMKKAKLNGTPLSLIIFDLDHFKIINDIFFMTYESYI